MICSRDEQEKRVMGVLYFGKKNSKLFQSSKKNFF